MSETIYLQSRRGGTTRHIAHRYYEHTQYDIYGIANPILMVEYKCKRTAKYEDTKIADQINPPSVCWGCRDNQFRRAEPEVVQPVKA